MGKSILLICECMAVVVSDVIHHGIMTSSVWGDCYISLTLAAGQASVNLQQHTNELDKGSCSQTLFFNLIPNKFHRLTMKLHYMVFNFIFSSTCFLVFVIATYFHLCLVI